MLMLGSHMGSSFAQSLRADTKHRVLVVHLVDRGSRRDVVDVKVVDSAAPLRISPSGADTLNFLAIDGNGTLLVEGGVDDPRIFRSPLAQSGEPERAHESVILKDAHFLLRLPYIPAMKHIYLAKTDFGPNPKQEVRKKITVLSESIPITSIDLDSWLSSARN